MSSRTLAYAGAALIFLLLGFFVTYQLNRQLATTAPLADEHDQPATAPHATHPIPSASEQGEAPPAWPRSGELLTEDDIPVLPAEIQDLLADPGWNQPYITPSFAGRDVDQTAEAAGRAAGPYAVNLLIDAPLSADQTSYQLALQQDESGSYVDVSLHAQLAPNAAGRYPPVRACVWAFRDGTIQYFAGGREAQLLNTTHRYDLRHTQVRVFIVRLLLVDSEGGRSYADSLPIKIGAE